MDRGNPMELNKVDDRIVMLTAYDYPMGRFLDQSPVDIILVGDSLANVALGLDSTRDVGMQEMIHHAKAVNRGVEKTFLIGDMPYEAYQVDGSDPVRNARRFMDEAGCDGVKLEWFDGCLEVTENILQAGIPVMGHAGLTPQTAEDFNVQGTDAASGQEIIEQANQLEEVGCFSLVLECIPETLGQIITDNLEVPTIGIGAGRHCNGQVLVTPDLLGMYERFNPKFAKQYAELGTDILDAVNAFCEEVNDGSFPGLEHCYQMDPDEADQLT